MDPAVETLIGTLLYEGYALYPYTASATKNATPTPFGIVYPPDYADAECSAFARLRMQGIAHADAGATIAAELRFLQAAGEQRYSATERRAHLAPRTLAELAREPVTEAFDFDGLTGRVRLAIEPLAPGRWRVAMCAHNTTPPGATEPDRFAALQRSLLSTHPIVQLDGGTFASPLEGDCESHNTFPILASDADDVLLGAAIMLPDHPRLAPESRGDLFDGTEIEEALLLHVLALSDGERAEIAGQDPALRAMVERAAAATPEDLIALHGRTVLSDPHEEAR